MELLSSSEKLVLTIEDAEGSYIDNIMYFFIQDSDPTTRQIRHTINSSILSQLSPLEKHINYQLYENRKTKVTDYFNIVTVDKSTHITVSVGGLSLVYVLVKADSASKFESIHKGAPDMIITSTGTASDPFFIITFPSFKTIKNI